MAEKPRLKVPKEAKKGEIIEIKTLLSHPMETGLRKDTEGQLVPAHFIELLTITYQDRTVLSAQWGPAVSRNPYLAFRFKGAKKGEKLLATDMQKRVVPDEENFFNAPYFREWLDTKRAPSSAAGRLKEAFDA